MGFMDIPKFQGVVRPPVKHCSLEGAAQLIFPDGRSVPVTAKLSMSRGFFWLSGGGSFTCEERIALDAIYSPGWIRLVFDGKANVEINVFEVRTNQTADQLLVRGSLVKAAVARSFDPADDEAQARKAGRAVGHPVQRLRRSGSAPEECGRRRTRRAVLQPVRIE